MFCALTEQPIAELRWAEYYVEHPEELPAAEATRLFILNRIRRLAESGKLKQFAPRVINHFVRSLSQEQRLTMLVDLVPLWGQLGADEALLETLWEVTGVSP